MVTGLRLGLEASPVPCNWATALHSPSAWLRRRYAMTAVMPQTGFGLDLGGGIALLARANSRSLGEVGTFRGALE